MTKLEQVVAAQRVPPDVTVANSALLFKLQFSRVEAAEILGVSLRTLDRLIAEKQLPVRRIGRRVLITKDALMQFTRRDHQTAVIQ